MKKNLLALFFFLLVLLIATFVWNENFDVHEKINDVKIGNFGIALGSLLSATTILFLYLQVGEMKKGRLLFALPHILPLNVNLQTIDNTTPALLGYGETILPVFYQNGKPVRPMIELFNIGTGVAKNVIVNWMYDMQKVNEYIDGKYSNYNSENSNEKIKFIPKEASLKCSLPYQYLICCGSKLNVTLSELALGGDDPKSKPDLMLNLQYEDIDGKKYNIKYACNVDAIEENVSINFD